METGKKYDMMPNKTQYTTETKIKIAGESMKQRKDYYEKLLKRTIPMERNMALAVTHYKGKKKEGNQMTEKP